MILNRSFTGQVVNAGFQYLAPQGDSVPDAIASQTISNAQLSTWIEFAPVQVTGIDVAVIASISGGEMAVSTDGIAYGAYSSANQSVENTYWIQARVFSADTHLAPEEAVLSIGGLTPSFTVNTLSGVYIESKEILKVSRTNDYVFLHDGKQIPQTNAKSPLSRIFKGFVILGMAEDETILSHAILINGQLVSPGDVVDGMTFHGSQTDGKSQVKAEISGGIEGHTYRLTLNYSTAYVPSDYRSQDFEVKQL